jgi:hypothetical protein
MGYKYNRIRNQRPGYTNLSGTIETGALGVLSTMDLPGASNWERVSIGRFRLTLEESHALLDNVLVCFEATSEVGLRYQVRSHNIQADAGIDPSIDILFYDYNSPGNLSDPASTTIHITLDLVKSNIG